MMIALVSWQIPVTQITRVNLRWSDAILPKNQPTCTTMVSTRWNHVRRRLSKVAALHPHWIQLRRLPLLLLLTLFKIVEAVLMWILHGAKPGRVSITPNASVGLCRAARLVSQELFCQSYNLVLANVLFWAILHYGIYYVLVSSTHAGKEQKRSWRRGCWYWHQKC